MLRAILMKVRTHDLSLKSYVHVRYHNCWVASAWLVPIKAVPHTLSDEDLSNLVHAKHSEMHRR
jgi:hypothetical protein